MPSSPAAPLARLLFRLRGVTPVPLLVVVVAASWRAHARPGPGGAEVDAALDAAGLGLAALGSVVRALVAGFEPRVNSQSRRLHARALLTTGPYAAMRHPLYLGNALIILGLACVVNDPWAWALGLLGFAFSTTLIVRAEEALLEQRFGDAWRAWAGAVPAVSLDPRRWRALRGLPFDWRTAVRREANPLVAWGLTAALLLAWEWWAREALTPPRELALRAAAGALLALLVLNKAWKLARP